ncbi:MAG: thiamine phosphate synthase, partial [Burkholderiales bacterium]|nr:thiamine phosphate synthase [Burkholderiales bacterium]
MADTPTDTPTDRPTDRTTDRTTDPWARAIVQAHADRLGLPVAGSAPPAPGGDDGADPVLQAALRAAHALGFVAADALCVARAWVRQTRRTGAFDAAAWPCEPVDFGLGPWPRDGAFAPCPQALGLYAVLPDAAWVGRMARAGVPTLQLRFKSDDARAVQAQVRAAVAAVQGTGARLVVNDHWRAAIDAGAWGVHLGQEDLDRVGAAALPALRAAGLRLGLSTHGYAEMLRAEALGPSYIALGAVFPTTLKAMPTPPQGLGRLAVYARLLRHRPLVAIGGI